MGTFEQDKREMIKALELRKTLLDKQIKRINEAETDGELFFALRKCLAEETELFASKK